MRGKDKTFLNVFHENLNSLEPFLLGHLFRHNKRNGEGEVPLRPPRPLLFLPGLFRGRLGLRQEALPRRPSGLVQVAANSTASQGGERNIAFKRAFDDVSFPEQQGEDLLARGREEHGMPAGSQVRTCGKVSVLFSI